jgi:hypothetical protein
MVSASRMNADHLSGRGGHTTTAPISPVSTNGQIASNSPLATPRRFRIPIPAPSPGRPDRIPPGCRPPRRAKTARADERRDVTRSRPVR